MTFKKLIFALLVINMISSHAQETHHSFSYIMKKKMTYRYILNKPKQESLKPLIIFLHGSGEKGDDLNKVKIHGPLKYVDQNPLDAYILAPQCPVDEYWDSDMLYQLILHVLEENPMIDKNRIYLTGLSMGAWGAWNLAVAHSELFAALVPIAGYTDRVPLIEACELKDIPIQIFHGLLDNVVPYTDSVEIYLKLKVCNDNVHITIFDDADHDSWTRVYDNNVIYDWMLKQKKAIK